MAIMQSQIQEGSLQNMETWPSKFNSSFWDIADKTWTEQWKGREADEYHNNREPWMGKEN